MLVQTHITGLSNEEKIHVQGHMQQDHQSLQLLTDTTSKKGSLAQSSFQRCLTFTEEETKD